ncbi:MAG: hypothetical protein WCA07_08040 [Gloeobacterales cyanobacterium]
MQKLLLYSGIGGMVAIFVGTSVLLVNARKADLSYAIAPSPLQGEQVNRCYPTTFQSPNELRYAESDDGYRYYEAIAKFRGQSDASKYTTLYLRTKGDACKWLNRSDWQSGRLKFMPEPVAIALAKLRYGQVVKQCEGSLPKGGDPKDCIKQLEQAINQPTNWSAVQIDYLFPDDAEALKEMGVATNKVLVVESVQDLEQKKRLQQEVSDESAKYSRRSTEKISPVLPARFKMPESSKTP